jgi:hypothetical protein
MTLDLVPKNLSSHLLLHAVKHADMNRTCGVTWLDSGPYEVGTAGYDRSHGEKLGSLIRAVPPHEAWAVLKQQSGKLVTWFGSNVLRLASESVSRSDFL